MAEQSGEKTEQPTHKKLEDARKKGQISKSNDLTACFVFVTSFFALGAIFPWIVNQCKATIMKALFMVSQRAIAEDEITSSIYHGVYIILILSIPVALVTVLIGLLVEILQTGALFSTEPLVPKLEKLNPIEGIKKLFSMKQFVELIKNILKLTITSYLAYGVIKYQLRDLTLTARVMPQISLAVLSDILFKITYKMTIFFIVMAVFDVWWQKRSFTKEMMMTKDEVKREYKESEGDPHHKAKRRELHQEILEQGMMRDVAKSDVVVTNPDHYAVALKYDHELGGAPKVIIKGMDEMAQKIKACAAKAGIMQIHNIKLAHSLFEVPVGHDIPEFLYDAVAEVLSFVYAEERKRMGDKREKLTN